MDLRELVIKVECGTKSGTAFFVSINRALTAYHNVTEAEDNEIICTNNSGLQVKAKVSDQINEHYKKLDVALLVFEETVNIPQELSFTDYKEIKSGTNWISRGFPSAKGVSGDNILLGDNNVVNQQLSSLRNNKVDIELEHSKKLSTYAGYSGSPLVINNTIAGIINQELLENGESKELTALSVKHFRDLLISEGIEIIEKNSSQLNPLRKVLSPQWFERHINRAIRDLGVRYTPEVNVKLGVTQKIDALLKNEGFCEEARAEFHRYLLSVNSLIGNFSSFSPFEKTSSEHSTQLNLINEITIIKQSIQKHFENFSENIGVAFDFVELVNKAKNVSKLVDSLARLYLDNAAADEKIADAKTASARFIAFLDNPDSNILLANKPYLLLKGKAGTGKSHLLADAVAAQQGKDVPAILLLGQHFTTDKSPWTQILSDILRLDCTENQFLEALNEIGEERGQRVLFCIDAINEGRGKFFWAEHFISFVNDFENYPWISLIVSVRDTYFPKLIPAKFDENTHLKTATHRGFVGREYEAIKVFFHYYEINLPKIPYLKADFSNPLFLKLFCEGLCKRGLHEVPEGYGGISSVMNYFIDNIDMKLGGSKYYDYDSSAKVCRKIVNGLIKHKQENDLSYIPYDDACDIANNVVERYTSKRGIIEDLVHEGLLSKNLYWLDGGDDEEGIYFAYERLDDHFLADLIARTIITSKNISKIFKVGGELFYLIQNEYRYQGVIEALSILLPELHGKDLFELVDHEEQTIIDAFINSLIWRDLDTIKSNCNDYINNTVLQYEDSFHSFLEFMYTVAGDVKHPYNANKLHNFLVGMPLADRDAEWTIHLRYVYEPEGSIDKMLEWLLQSDIHKTLSDESALLVSISVSWLLTSTTLELRNKATKALSNILINKLHIGGELLRKFELINDLYVYERILAAVYGATLNTVQLNELSNLAHYIVEHIFLKEEVYPNVLVRDYARNIVEYALYKEKIELTDPEIIRPPYNSTLPDNYPSNEEIDSYKFDWDGKGFKQIYGSQNRILSSMVTQYRRGMSSYGDFGRYTFQYALRSWKNLDPNLLSNYACKLIFEKFGYNVDMHGQFDRYAGSGDRFENKVERIGKKYQWLALYEVVARVADNAQLTDWDGNEVGYFQGPWQNYLRNIDPTFSPQRTIRTELPAQINHVSYEHWDDEEQGWLTSENGLLDPKEMILNGEFLSLEGDFSWSEPERLGVDRDTSDKKSLWYQVRSYLVKESEYENLKEWLKDQDFMGRWMPESSENYSIFSKEHYWSPAYHDRDEDTEETRWQPIGKNRLDHRNEEIIADVLPTAEEHRWEDEDSTSFLAPRIEMFDGMGLCASEIPSCWFNDRGQLACFDPHVFGEEKSELLVNRNLLEEFLNKNGLKILWTVLGEKQTLGSWPVNNWIDISGVYYLCGNSVEGSFTVNLKYPG